jgi:selenocysteine-specific elongation factor
LERLTVSGVNRSAELRPVVVGTAGHIDHGKTSLVRRLTGINTDRLPEEKQRGISIDLGFAVLRTGGFEFGFVDVPGHERFVHNMVAGASGVDLALLVAAADDGVMPQTREHFEILVLLGVTAGVVAVTKRDLVDARRLHAVTLEIRSLLAGSPLQGAPIVAVSNTTGQGIADLQSVLCEVAAAHHWKARQSWFRMPIDRVFSRPGAGVVVTGTVIGGAVSPGDELEVAPTMQPVRVRGVQTHGQDVASTGDRQRTALSLVGVRQSDLRRGNELAAAGALQPTIRLLAGVRCLASAGQPLKDRQQCRLHVGTQEETVRLRIFSGSIPAGSEGIAELQTTEPLVATHGQRGILRRLSPAATIAGITVLDPRSQPLKTEANRRVRVTSAMWTGRANCLRSANPVDRLTAVTLDVDDLNRLSPRWAAWKLGVDPAEWPGVIDAAIQQGAAIRLGRESGRESGVVLLSSRFDELSAIVLRRLNSELARKAPRQAVPRAELVGWAAGRASERVVAAVVDELVRRGLLIERQGTIGPANAQVKLTRNQQAWRDRMRTAIVAAGLSPPTLGELSRQLGQPAEVLRPILALDVSGGELVGVTDDLYFSTAAIADARSRAISLLVKGPATAAALKESWGTSRKYAVPLCEYFDAVGVTVRQGDLRVAGRIS